MLTAVASGPVILGDKERRDVYEQYNVGYCGDLMQPGASAWGTDWLADTKVPSPHTRARHAGRGSHVSGGTVADVGHLYGGGNTEEALHLKVSGCRERGRPSDGFFNHATGAGWVKAKKGDYHDAIRNKNNQVLPLVVEVYGGVGRTAARLIRFSARRAQNKKHGRDSTHYSRFRRHTSYLAHHTRAISGAAVFGDARHIEAAISDLKSAMLGPSVPTVDQFIEAALAAKSA